MTRMWNDEGEIPYENEVYEAKVVVCRHVETNPDE